MDLELRSFKNAPKDHNDFKITASFKYQDKKLLIESKCTGAKEIIEQLEYDQSLQGRKNDLWKATCFEFFCYESAASNEYIEWNFSPSNAYQVFYFKDYRKSAEFEHINYDFKSEWQRQESSLLTKIEIVSPPQIQPELVNLTWVLKTKSGISYWAANHPDNSPDFHQKSCFLRTD